jgi:hypothetical protein
VQQTINDNVAFPLTGLAIAPDLVGISLVTTLSLPAGLSATDQDMVISNAVAAAQDYIDNLAVGQQLVINEIADRIRNADARILDVGQPNKQIPEIFIWRSRDDGTRYSRSKVEYSFISCFITSPPLILRASAKLMRWDSQILQIRKGGNGYGTRSRGPLSRIPARRARTGVKWGYCSTGAPGVARSCGAALPQFPHEPKRRSASLIEIGLEIVPFLDTALDCRMATMSSSLGIGCPAPP